MDRTCTNCGASEWTELVQESYPDRRRERDQTTKRVFKCQNCGEEGKKFERGLTGTTQYTGVLRDK